MTRPLILGLAAWVLAVPFAPGVLAAATYYVNAASPTCSNSGPGTPAIPYCSITAAVTAHNGPGTTILVNPGIYREQVTVPASGSPTSPFVIQATGPGVVVDGADSFTNPAQWAQQGTTDVWLASAVTWSPLQVFADGSRLAVTTLAPESMPTRTFRYVAGTGLYVHAGGGNPATHGTVVGRRLYGIRLSGRSYVVIDGFEVSHTEEKGIYLSGSSNVCTITNNHIVWNYRYGFQATTCNGLLIARNVVTDNSDHGMALTGGSSGCTVEDNESARNAHPTVRQSNGLYMYDAPSNLIQRNRFHDNQDTGHHMQTGSNNNVCIQNLSWGNGDHGYDMLGATGSIRVGDVAWGNYKDGFSIEGTSPNTTVSNCISVNNGITTNEYDIWVDTSSLPGLASNDNLFWNSTTQPPIRAGSTTYATVVAFSSATGQDTRSIQSNPLFVNPAGGDFHLAPSSPAIDNANSGVANWPALDAEGHARFDDPSRPNTGLGPVAYADRGALERQTASNQPPTVSVPALVNGNENALVTVNVSAGDPDGEAITSLTADLAATPGAVFTPAPNQASGVLTWTPGYTDSGSHVVTFTATNTLSGQASTTLHIANVDRPPTVAAPPNASGPEATPIVVNVTAADPDGDAITSLTADLSALPPSHGATFVAGPGQSSGTLTWTPTYQDSGVYVVTFTANNASGGASTPTTIHVTNADRAPVVSAPALAGFVENAPESVAVSVTDPDGDPIASLVANLSALPGSHNAIFTPAPGNTSGWLTWTPTYSDSGTYAITFEAANASLGSQVTQIHVANSDRPPVITAPANVSVTEGSPVSVPVTVTDPDGDAVASLTADLSGIPPGTNPVFTPEPDNASGTLAWTPPVGLGRTLPYQVVFAATSTLSVQVVTRIRVDRREDHPPVTVAPAFLEEREDSLLTVQVTVTDPEGDAITSLEADLSEFPLVNDASFTVSVDRTSGTLTWTPGYADSGLYHVRFTATSGVEQLPAQVTIEAAGGVSVSASPFKSGVEGAGGTRRMPVDDPTGGRPFGTAVTEIHVRDWDRAPVVLAPALVSGPEAATISFQIGAADPEGESIATLAADLSGLPAGNKASFTPGADHASGTFTWTPTFADAGTYSVMFTATNALVGADTTTITVGPIDRAPVVVAPADAAGSEGTLVTFDVTASDPDGDPFTLSADLAGLPPGNDAAFTPGGDPASGTFSWTPSLEDSGTYVVVFTAANALAGSDTARIVVSPAPIALAGRIEPATDLEARARGEGDGALSLAGEGRWEAAIELPPSTGPARVADIEIALESHAGAAHCAAIVPGSRPGTFIAEFERSELRRLFGVLSAGLHRVMMRIDGDLAGGPHFHAALPVTVDAAPLEFSVRLASNPVRGHGSFTLTLPHGGPLRVDLFDLGGRRVHSVLDQRQCEPGVHDVPFETRTADGGRLEPGLYFYRVTSRDGVRSGNLVVLN